MDERLKQERLGKITASEGYKIIGEDDNKFTKGAETYLWSIVAELQTGLPSNDSELETWDMRFGKEWEQFAFDEAVEIIKPSSFQYFGEDPQFFAFLDGWAGASPDGIINGFPAEIKCPANSANHSMYCREIRDTESLKKVKKEYYFQVQMQMMAMEVKQGYFISFDYRNMKKKCHIVDVKAVEKDQDLLDKKLKQAIKWIIERY
jgi:hypothetical protein